MDPLVFLTAGLLIVTGYYAWHTQRMAAEMKSSRELAVLPKLAADIRFRFGSLGFLRLTNVGQGVALDVDVRIVFEPAEGSSYPQQERRWQAAVVAPGERRDFRPPSRRVVSSEGETTLGGPLSMEDLAREYASILVGGEMRDSLNNKHAIDERVTDLAELHALRQLEGSWGGGSPLEEGVRQLNEHLSSIDRHLSNLVDVGRGTDFMVQMQRRFEQGGASGADVESP